MRIQSIWLVMTVLLWTDGGFPLAVSSYEPVCPSHQQRQVIFYWKCTLITTLYHFLSLSLGHIQWGQQYKECSRKENLHSCFLTLWLRCLSEVIIPWPSALKKKSTPSAYSIGQQRKCAQIAGWGGGGGETQGQMERHSHLFEVRPKHSCKDVHAERGWKTILLLCLSATKNSSCWAGRGAELHSLLLLPFPPFSVAHCL